MKKACCAGCVLLVVALLAILPAGCISSGRGGKSAEAESNICIDCHRKETPNIVKDWELSRHSKEEVDCSVCHGDEHVNAMDVANVEIPTVETCDVCHEGKVSQFKKGKHALAWAAMKAMPTAHWQPMALMEGMKGCGGCHKIGLKSKKDITEIKHLAQEMRRAAEEKK